MRNWATFMADCVSLLLVAFAWGADLPPGEIPFELCPGYTIVAEGEIGSLQGLRFLIDTGAMPSVVDERIAHRLRLSGEAEAVTVFSRKVKGQRVVLPSLKLGPIQVKSLRVVVRDLTFVEAQVGTRVDAMLGLDVLGSRSFIVDFPARRILFAPQSLPDTARVPASHLWYLVVKAEVQGCPVRLLVDTGSSELILFRKRLRGRLPELRVIGEAIISNMGGRARVQRVSLPSVHLGNTEISNLEAFLMDAPEAQALTVDGLLGVGSLGARRISFDFEGHRFSWVH
jgi:predicted aspartyl protease